MIEGHGDDIYQYESITSDFSSNICQNPSAYRAVTDHLSQHPQLLAHYPEPEAWSLEQMIAERDGVKSDNVIVTNGATEAIYLIAQTFRYQHYIPQPTFSEYADACRMFTPNDKIKNSIWLCNPNNPTGSLLPAWKLDDALFYFRLVIVDQSYEHYTHQPLLTATEAIKKKRIILLRSMTKDYGVPGLRLGYIVAHKSLAKQIRQHMRPWSVSALAVEAGKYLLQHDELICCPGLEEAQRLHERLCEIEGIEVEPTQTNFMLCRLTQGSAAELKEYLAKEHHILIRDASNFKGLTPQHFRIAAQTPAENDALVEAVRSFTSHLPFTI